MLLPCTWHCWKWGSWQISKSCNLCGQINCTYSYKWFFPLPKCVIFGKWQTLWNEESENNKLKEIKSTSGVWPSFFQREHRTEVVLSQLHFGHTLLTHGYLMNTPHNPIPQCTHCRTTLTMKHILTDCPVFARQRMSSIGKKNIKALLLNSRTFSSYTVIKFLKSCDLLHKI